jgi:hypothetical protein
MMKVSMIWSSELQTASPRLRSNRLNEKAGRRHDLEVGYGGLAKAGEGVSQYE